MSTRHFVSATARRIEMDPTRISLFDLAERKLAWIDRRSQVLAADVANADTPGWRAHDLKPFDSMLARSDLAMRLSDPGHLAAVAPSGDAAENRNGDRAPDGNAVALDTVLRKVAETDASHELVTDIYKKYLGLFRTALGR